MKNGYVGDRQGKLQLISAWTQGTASLEEKATLETQIRSCSVALDRLTEILTDMETSLNSSELNTSNYDVPNWSCKQAHVNGQKATIRTIKRIINLDQKD